MKISKYVKKVVYKDYYILYHTKEHSVIQLPVEAIKNDDLKSDFLDEDSLTALSEMSFFSDTDDEIKDSLYDSILNDDKLFISVELNLSCNLRCPYCYQSGKHSGRVVSDDDLDYLIDYLAKVYEKRKYTDIYLKILGGEPTIVWAKFKKLYCDAKDFCETHNITMHLLIDTNGTMVDDLLSLEKEENILFTIPLTYKDCHDNVRRDARGRGTYESIIQNMNRIKKKMPHAKIVIRYNVDADNIRLFGDFLLDVKSKLCFLPLISVNYTAELNGKTEFDTGLTYKEFIEWSSSTAIDDLVEAKLPITISPVVSVEECQYRSRYSLKLFSDGTVGSCAMSFFDSQRVHISELLGEFDQENEQFGSMKRNQTLVKDKKCMECDCLFLCGGTCKLPCITALDANACEKKLYGINLDEFLPRYVECQERGISDLFVVFEEGESYR